MIPFWNKRRRVEDRSPGVTIGLDPGQIKATCPKCKNVHTGAQIRNRFYICPNCGKYMPIGARERLLMVLDEVTFEHWF